MMEKLEFWLTFFIAVAAGFIAYGKLQNQSEQNKADLAAHKLEIEIKLKEKKESIEKNNSVMWEKIDIMQTMLNNAMQAMVRIETKLDMQRDQK